MLPKNPTLNDYLALTNAFIAKAPLPDDLPPGSMAAYQWTVLQAMAYYLMRLESYEGAKAHIRILYPHINATQFKEFKKCMSNSYPVVMQLKFRIIYALRSMKSARLTVPLHPLVSLISKHPKFKELWKTVSELPTPYEEYYVQWLTANYAQIMSHSKNEAWKMRFVAYSNNLALTDLSMDILEKGIRTAYFLCPFYDDTHLIRGVKTAMTNYARNMITHHTSGKRLRLIQDGEGRYQNVILTYLGTSESGNQVEHPALIVEGEHDQVEENLFYSSLIMKSPEKYKGILKTLFGSAYSPDPNFLEFVKVNRQNYKDQDLDSLSPNAMITLARKFHKVSDSLWTGVKEYIRSHI